MPRLGVSDGGADRVRLTRAFLSTTIRRFNERGDVEAAAAERATVGYRDGSFIVDAARGYRGRAIGGFVSRTNVESGVSLARLRARLRHLLPRPVPFIGEPLETRARLFELGAKRVDARRERRRAPVALRFLLALCVERARELRRGVGELDHPRFRSRRVRLRGGRAVADGAQGGLTLNGALS